MKAALSFSIVFILFFSTGCIELTDIFDGINAASLTRRQQSAKKLPAVKIDESPIIDGKLNDAAWQDAPQGTDFTDRRAGGAPAEDQSVLMMAYTDEAIYVALYLFDSEPGGIVARQVEDQIRPFGEDWVSFTIDPFHTHQFVDRTFFMVNPLGSKFVSHPPPFAGLAEISRMWKAAARIVDEGWVVEMEIPWEMLDYPETNEPIDIGINVDRGHARTGANTWWSKVGFVEDDRADGHWIGVLPPPKMPILRDE